MPEKPAENGPEPIKDEQLLERLSKEVNQHYDASWNYMAVQRQGWDEKEALFLGISTDEGTGSAKSKVFDPRLSTMSLERAARVMYQMYRGEVQAVSEDDIGKAMFMDLMLRHVYRNANEQYPLLQKLRMTDLYSHVYGTIFCLVPWRVNERTGYIGPEYNILSPRDCFPQPGIPNLDDADYFQHETRVSVDWLESQKGEYWHQDNLGKLVERIKKGPRAGTKAASRAKQPVSGFGEDDDRLTNKDAQKMGVAERTMYGTPQASKGFPMVTLRHEYRSDMWITYCPEMADYEDGRELVLRVLAAKTDAKGDYVDGPYLKSGLLPVVKKDDIPLLDSIIAQSEFDRGLSLQKGLNSLWNLYLDTVKISTFPPLHINYTDGAVKMSSIKWGAGEKWLMRSPNRDVQAMESINPQGLQSFQTAYQYMLASLNSQGGTTDTSQAAQSAPTMGRTPEALKMLNARENARDSWDAFMMDRHFEQVGNRMVSLINEKMPKDVMLRLYPQEITRIRKQYPDIEEVLGEKRSSSLQKGRISVRPKDYQCEDGFDFVLEANSSMKPQPDVEAGEITSILQTVLQNAQILVPMMQREGKAVNVSELMERLVESCSTIKDPEKIIINIAQPTTDAAAQAGQPVPGAAPVQAGADPNAQPGGALPPQGMPDPAQQAAPQGMPPQGMPAQGAMPPPAAPPPQPQGGPDLSALPPQLQQIAAQLSHMQPQQVAQLIVGGQLPLQAAEILVRFGILSPLVLELVAHAQQPAGQPGQTGGFNDPDIARAASMVNVAGIPANR